MAHALERNGMGNLIVRSIQLNYTDKVVRIDGAIGKGGCREFQESEDVELTAIWKNADVRSVMDEIEKLFHRSAFITEEKDAQLNPEYYNKQ